MSEFSTVLPSGMRVRDIKTKLVGGKPVPDLDANGQEQELSVVHVPQSIEAAEGTAAERKAAIDGYVADRQVKSEEVALVRATARMAKQDPAAAESAFTAAQLAGNVAQEVALGDTIAAQPGGKS